MPCLGDELLRSAESNSKKFVRFSMSTPQIMRTTHCSLCPAGRGQGACLETPNELGATEGVSLTQLSVKHYIFGNECQRTWPQADALPRSSFCHSLVRQRDTNQIKPTSSNVITILSNPQFPHLILATCTRSKDVSIPCGPVASGGKDNTIS